MQNIKVLDYTRLKKKKSLFPLTAIQITILYKYPDHFLNHRFRYFMDIKKHALSVLLLFIRVFS
nr:MAG TPA: hypothetical protein [Caudoviricetes sp.]